MTSRSSAFASLGALVCAFAAVALGAACAETGGASDFSSTYAPPVTDASGSSSSTNIGLGNSDASTGVTTSNPVEGNPLCNASHYTGRCYPDDLITAQACAIAPDGSADYDLDAGYGDAAVSCHVVPVADAEAGVGPTCKAAGPGTDGTTCITSTDCAPSFECVSPGVCRQYCCYSTCDSTQFCDIQRETTEAGGLPVPVCMPIRPCALLASSAAPNATDGGESDADAGPSGACAAGQTCAVVSLSSGVALTSCVENGSAGAGTSCDAEHCGAGLMCLGTSGSRRCFQLCHTLDASSECPSTQTCTGGLPLFTDPMAGVCRAPVSQDQ
jgi:hypothetical protein